LAHQKKIQEFLRNAALEDWVRKGQEINKGRKFCAFCGNPITTTRWDKLHKHFDEETEKLIADLNAFLERLSEEELMIKSGFCPDEDCFYIAYISDLKALEEEYRVFCSHYIAELRKLRSFIERRQNEIIQEFTFSYDTVGIDCSKIFERYNKLRVASNIHGRDIIAAKNKAQDQLRLFEVKKFIEEIDFDGQIKRIEKLGAEVETRSKTLKETQEKVDEIERAISNKKHLLNDEEKGAVRVNEYLSTYFDHKNLSIRAVSFDDEEEPKIHFEVIRNGEKAFHLSEGETSLIAFCYFVAKLSDVETSGTRPIIWIDDPVSSLDSNHIYFIYSLIINEILEKDMYEQLFITTHNLQFLKYLRILSINNHNKQEKGNSRTNLVIERHGDFSVLKTMPKYLKEHGTEFNHWFECIYKCANQEIMTDNNFYLFESFGNNARKFLETYLYYRYPDKGTFNDHLKKFFGEDEIPSVIVRKVADEQSHAQGDLESHDSPFEEPETIDAAKLILRRLEDFDKEQYDALVSTVQ